MSDGAASRFCGQCGEAVRAAGQKFCGGCGAVLPGVTPAANPTPTTGAEHFDAAAVIQNAVAPPVPEGSTQAGQPKGNINWDTFHRQPLPQHTGGGNTKNLMAIALVALLLLVGGLLSRTGRVKSWFQPPDTNENWEASATQACRGHVHGYLDKQKTDHNPRLAPYHTWDLSASAATVTWSATQNLFDVRGQGDLIVAINNNRVGLPYVCQLAKMQANRPDAGFTLQKLWVQLP